MRISDWSSDVCSSDLDRLPRIDLVGLLTGNWIRMLGSTTSFDTWSTGAELSGPLFDGGTGAANERGAQARYREAAEALRGAVRTATRDVEDALAGQHSAQQRVVTSRQAVEDRTSVVSGKSVSVRVDLGVRRIIKNKNR